MEENIRSRISPGFFKTILKSVLAALTVTLIILLVAALLLCFADFPEKYAMPSAIAATILGVFAGSTMAARKNPEKSLSSSLLTAFIYSLISYIIGSIIDGRVSFSLNTVLFTAAALITGAIANILAKRSKSPKTYNKSSSGMFDKFNKSSLNKGYRFKGGKL